MVAYCKLFIIYSCLYPMTALAQPHVPSPSFTWKQLDRLPDDDGLAGAFAGVSHGALLVAGGTNFPGNRRPWTSGVKTWYDKIFVLDQPGGRWKEAGRLPRPLGYGVALTYQDELLCLGGGDAKQNFAECFSLSYIHGKGETHPLPDLPFSLINGCGAVIGAKVYIAGGIQTPAGLTENNFWCLDLSFDARKRAWKRLPAVPGPTRMLAMAAGDGDSFYVFGGVHLAVTPPDTAARREYLRDCWKYSPDKGWSQLADLPYPLAAAASPAFDLPGGKGIFIFGGDDGVNALRIAELKDDHPGFRNEILTYDTGLNTWSVAGTIPVDKKADAAIDPHGSMYAPVTTPLVVWMGKIVLAGGEARPAVRSNLVLFGEPVRQKR